MNNEQFRNLLLNNAKKDGTSSASPPTSRPSATPALGSRKHAFVPMTPRQVGSRNMQSEFARQLAERNGQPGGPPAKKFKSSAPKGVKLLAGYTDRAKARAEKDEEEEGEESEIAQRIKKLEEAMKLGQMDRTTFENLVAEITGGDIRSTHLVKGLDRKLLEKVRKGEVSLEELEQKKKDDAEREAEEQEVDDDEFDALLERDIAPVAKEKVEKKGEKAPPMAPPPVAGVKRSRNDILAELKAQRKAAAEAAAAEYEKKYPSLGPGFRKVGPGGETTRIEVDERGRQVLIITGPDGKEKRKVRKQKVEEPKLEPRFDIDNPDKPIHVPVAPEPPKEESEDEDIFEGVGSNYNPLAGLEDDEDSSSDEEESKPHETKLSAPPTIPKDEAEGQASPQSPEPTEAAQPPQPKPKRNWFDSTPTPSTAEQDAADATVRAALAKVRTLDPTSSTLLADTEEARLAKRAKELASRDRDMDDIDMGFGESRFDDAEDMEMEGQKVKLAEWKGLGAEDDDDEPGHVGKGGGKRKRGPKKKKGDKNSVADVMKVMERQKGAKTLG